MPDLRAGDIVMMKPLQFFLDNYELVDGYYFNINGGGFNTQYTVNCGHEVEVLYYNNETKEAYINLKYSNQWRDFDHDCYESLERTDDPVNVPVDVLDFIRHDIVTDTDALIYKRAELSAVSSDFCSRNICGDCVLGNDENGMRRACYDFIGLTAGGYDEEKANVAFKLMGHTPKFRLDKRREIKGGNFFG